ncbi:hypothetical protein [Streptomyces beigongshangae]|nr:hypothetical protein [Streptomyces sp. REN17]
MTAMTAMTAVLTATAADSGSRQQSGTAVVPAEQEASQGPARVF